MMSSDSSEKISSLQIQTKTFNSDKINQKNDEK